MRFLNHLSASATLLIIAGCTNWEPIRCKSGIQCPIGYFCTSSGDACIAAAGCGDGKFDKGEKCDDGNLISGDGCSSDCKSDETCGNGVRDTQVGEVCDYNVDASCRINCKSTQGCGDGHVGIDEPCDDGNEVSGDGCSSTCQLEFCGNGISDPGEACDKADPAFAYCSEDCHSDGSCGNGLLDPGEVCDDRNLESGDGCSANCDSTEFCGNGKVDDVLGEECDNGEHNVDEPDECLGTRDSEESNCCTKTCQSHCGDGRILSGERCEPGLPWPPCIDAGAYDMGLVVCNDCLSPSVERCRNITHIEIEPELTQGENLNGVWAPNASSIFVVGSGDSIHRYNGSLWVQESVAGTSPLPTLFDIWGHDPATIFAVGAAGTVVQRSAATETWSWESIGTKDLHSVWGSGANSVHAVGAEGTILHYSGTWSGPVTPRPTGVDLYDVWGSGAGSVYAVGATGIVLHYDGVTWSLVNTIPTHEDLYGIWGSGANDIYVVGNAGTILHYDGTNWEKLSSVIKTRLLDVWGNSSQDVFVAGRDGTILHYDGFAWSPVRSHTNRDLHAVRTVQATTELKAAVVAGNGAFLHFSYPEIHTQPLASPGGEYAK